MINYLEKENSELYKDCMNSMDHGEVDAMGAMLLKKLGERKADILEGFDGVFKAFHPVPKRDNLKLPLSQYLSTRGKDAGADIYLSRKALIQSISATQSEN